MAYTPTVWKNKVIEKPRTYTVQNNPDSTITLIPSEGVVQESGTPVNAINLNKLENGVASAHTAVADLQVGTDYMIDDLNGRLSLLDEYKRKLRMGAM